MLFFVPLVRFVLIVLDRQFVQCDVKGRTPFADPLNRYFVGSWPIAMVHSENEQTNKRTNEQTIMRSVRDQ